MDDLRKNLLDHLKELEHLKEIEQCRLTSESAYKKHLIELRMKQVMAALEETTK